MWIAPPSVRRCRRPLACFTASIVLAAAASAHAEPRVILISLDGATPRLVDAFMRDGAIPRDEGLGLLEREGMSAERNMTINPSLTASGHIAIATGSNPARNDIPGNTFHLRASPFTATASGFGAPIGGYGLAVRTAPFEESHVPTAEPLWLRLRAAGKRVVAATLPGADGVDVRMPGLARPARSSRATSGA